MCHLRLLKKAGHSIRKFLQEKDDVRFHGLTVGSAVRFCSRLLCSRAPPLLQNIRVVLVNTSHPGNIGGAARAMKNMGLSRLVLVEPRVFPHHEADARASGAGDILENAQVVATLEDALVGCNLVLGTSA